MTTLLSVCHGLCGSNTVGNLWSRVLPLRAEVLGNLSPGVGWACQCTRNCALWKPEAEVCSEMVLPLESKKYASD